WPSTLQDAGYKTGYFGKWHVEQTNQLENFGWDEYDRAGSLRMDRVPGTDVTVPKTGYRDYLLSATGDDSEGAPVHPAFTNGIDFIRRHAGGDAPFCCFVSTTEPHDPYVPPKRFLDLYDQESVPLSTTLHEESASNPEVVKRMRSVWSGMDDGDWRKMSAAYWAVISFIDHEIGRIVQVLKDVGVYDDTIIVFTSDHGDMLGGHGLVAKGIGTAYEEVYNIPLIVRVPGLAGGVEDDATHTSLVDVGATLLDLLGLEPLSDAHGKSLRSVLEGVADADDWRDAYAEFFGQRFVYTQRITWHDDWKYVFSPGGVDELYNLAEDPCEQMNLADSSEHRGQLEAMCTRMWRRMREIGDESLFNTHYATLRTAPVGPGVLDDE
ncbi:MAG: sulfatase-like hydrolase/transferase, partial [Lentisphaeria bacterium]|nr:sulfatase-like hydrolase/transferase [Lentisphaeria bacterium]